MYSMVSNNNNALQNFGFKVKVLEGSKLKSMRDSYLFRKLPNFEIDKFEAKADAVLPDKTIVMSYEVKTPMPYEDFNVDIFRGDKKVDRLEQYDSHAILTYLKRSANPYTVAHSKFFYDGEKSPEMQERGRKFAEKIYRYTKH